MHISEGFLPPVHAAAWTVAAAPFIIHGARTLTRQVREDPESRMLLGAVGAFAFVLSALKLPSVTGSSSHPTGTGLGAVLFKPPVMAVLGSIVLLFQALLLAHGGLTTLGANAFAMAIVGPWVAWFVFRLIGRAHLSVAVFAAVALSDLATYVTTATQLALAYPDAVSGFVGAWSRFLAIFALTQVPLAVVEGLIAVALVKSLMAWAGTDMARLPGLRGPASHAAPRTQDREAVHND